MGLTKNGPGKFNTLVDEIAYSVSLNGCDDECGDSQSACGWAGLIRGRIKTTPPLADITPEQYNMLSEHDRRWIEAHPAGFIVTENSDGFVTVDWYKDAEALEERWREYSQSETEDAEAS